MFSDKKQNTEVQTPRRSAGIFSAVGMTLLGTTCCALPITLVALGAGGAVASIASAAPWLIALSKYKSWTFTATALALAFAWFQARRVGVDAESCDVRDVKRLRWQKRALVGSTFLFAASLFAAYALLPIVIWLDPTG